MGVDPGRLSVYFSFVLPDCSRFANKPCKLMGIVETISYKIMRIMETVSYKIMGIMETVFYKPMGIMETAFYKIMGLCGTVSYKIMGIWETVSYEILHPPPHHHQTFSVCKSVSMKCTPDSIPTSMTHS